MKPSYLRLKETGELKVRAEQARKQLQQCTLCPHHCQVDRTFGERGFCQATDHIYVAHHGPHYGEESPLVGTYGSGTIFFTYCNMHCAYCQNYSVSRGLEGKPITVERLAQMILELQEGKCHNINFVSPSHYVPQIIAAVELAAEQGLHTPLVYNSGGYESLDTLKLLDGVIDIYMPDIKYSRDFAGQEFSQVKNYFSVVKEAVKEMHNQVGDLRVNDKGVAERGLILRHLVLPMNVAGTEEVIRFIVDEISPYTYVNIMNQYDPQYKAEDYPSLCRPIHKEEYEEAVRIAKELGPDLILV